MLANLCKRLTITTDALLLIRMACNCLRLCCEYDFLTKFRKMFLIFAIPLERSKYERMSGDELSNIVMCKRIKGIMVSPLFTVVYGPIHLILATDR